MLENARNAWKRTSSQWHARKTRSSELIKSYAHPSTALAFFSPTVWNARKNWITHLNSSPTSFPHQISTCELCTRKITHNNFSGKQKTILLLLLWRYLHINFPALESQHSAPRENAILFTQKSRRFNRPSIYWYFFSRSPSSNTIASLFNFIGASSLRRDIVASPRPLTLTYPTNNSADSISSRFRSTTPVNNCRHFINPFRCEFSLSFQSITTCKFHAVRKLWALRLHSPGTLFTPRSPNTTTPSQRAITTKSSTACSWIFDHFGLNHNHLPYSSSQIYYGRINISINRADFNSSQLDPFHLIQHAKGKGSQACCQEDWEEEEGYVDSCSWASTYGPSCTDSFLYRPQRTKAWTFCIHVLRQRTTW